MNMHEIPRVLRTVSSMTLRLSRRLARAARVAAVAPTAELSTRLVTPMTNSPVMKKKMRKGMIPARSSRSFSLMGRFRSASLTVGPRWGCTRHRITM